MAIDALKAHFRGCIILRIWTELPDFKGGM